MRRLLLLVACATACGAPQHPPPAPGRQLDYVILTAGRPSGDAEIHIDPDGTRHTHFTFNDRGRGPDLHTDATFDQVGTLLGMRVTGHAYEKQPVDERLDQDGEHVDWSSAGEMGNAMANAGYYVPRHDPMTTTGPMIHVMARSPGKKLALLPAGSAWIEDEKEIDVMIAGRSMRLREIAIAGIEMTPQLWWLDSRDEVFASVNPWFAIVRKGAESLVPTLLADDQAWLTARNARLATELAHRPPAAGLAITHANVFDAEKKRLVADRTVIVVGDRITAIGDAKTAIPDGAQVIDAHGRTLLPGLWDMHVHLVEGDGLVQLAFGITTVRDLGNDIDDLTARVKRFDDGTEVGPRVVRAGLIDGRGALAAPAGVLVSDEDEAKAAVAKYADLGYAQIKIYSSVPPALVPVITKAAHDRGLRVSGHIPNGMNASEAVEDGYDEIQHVNFLFLQFLAGPDDDTRTPLRYVKVAEQGAALDLGGDDVKAFLDLLAAHKTVLDPTVQVFDGMFVDDPGEMDPALAPYAGRLPPQVERGARAGGLDAPGDKRATFRASFAKLLEMVARAWKRGIPIVAGTDGPAGFGLPLELELYVKAGIPAPEVLALDTLGAARVMHLDGDRGSIAVGKRADLLLVDGDPTHDISAVRKADVVVCRGVVYDPHELFRAIGMR
jgi:hypothetical protein